MTRYRTIVADPPWEVTAKMGAGGRRARATEIPYSMWTTRRLFREGSAAKVARAWGFEPCGEVIWGLRNAGMGGILGNGHEPVLIASRGGLPFPKNALPCGVQFWKQPYAHGKIHSAKPEGFLDWVEQISPGPYVELFARRARFGWDYWGDQSLGTAEMPDVAA